MSVATPALPVRAERLWAALLAATLMNLPLGSVYSFSVLLRPIEQELAIPRSALSLVFGLARWASRWARSAPPSSIASLPRRSWCWRARWWPPAAS